MHQCPQCNSLVQDERPYCSKCGAAQFISQATLVCETCGRELPAPMRFCKWCGAAQTKHQNNGASDLATTTAPGSEGNASLTNANIEAPASAYTVTDLRTNATTSVLDQFPELTEQAPAYIEKAATTGELAPLSPDADSFVELSEETLVRPLPSPLRTESYGAETLAAPDFTVRHTPAMTVAATQKKRTVFPLFGVGLFALLLGTGLAFLLFQHFYRVPASRTNASQPVVPVPLPNIGTRAAATAPATSMANSAVAELPPPIINAPVPSSSAQVAANESANTQAPPAETASQPSDSSTARSSAASSAQLPQGGRRQQGTGEWSGTVIGSAVIEFYGRNQSVVGSAHSLRSAHLSLDSGLPQANAIVRVNKRKGRGQITVVQQPSANNNYTARVQITNDRDAASEDYVFDFTWEAAAP